MASAGRTEEKEGMEGHETSLGSHRRIREGKKEDEVMKYQINTDLPEEKLTNILKSLGFKPVAGAMINWERIEEDNQELDILVYVEISPYRIIISLDDRLFKDKSTAIILIENITDKITSQIKNFKVKKQEGLKPIEEVIEEYEQERKRMRS